MTDDRDHRWMANKQPGDGKRPLLWQLILVGVALFLIACGMGIAALVDRVLPVLVALSGAMQ
jgi:hypothetical protein